MSSGGKEIYEKGFAESLNEPLRKPVAYPDEGLATLCEHKGVLYDVTAALIVPIVERALANREKHKPYGLIRNINRDKLDRNQNSLPPKYKNVTQITEGFYELSHVMEDTLTMALNQQFAVWKYGTRDTFTNEQSHSAYRGFTEIMEYYNHYNFSETPEHFIWKGQNTSAEQMKHHASSTYPLIFDVATSLEESERIAHTQVEGIFDPLATLHTKMFDKMRDEMHGETRRRGPVYDPAIYRLVKTKNGERMVKIKGEIYTRARQTVPTLYHRWFDDTKTEKCPAGQIVKGETSAIHQIWDWYFDVAKQTIYPQLYEAHSNKNP